MFITQESDYAVRIIHTLAHNPGRTGAKAIAEEACVTLRFSLKILRKLVGNGLVQSYKGVQGGYELARPLAEINLYDIIETIDGPFMLIRCQNDDYECSRMGKERCRYHDVFTAVSLEARDSLRKVCMADFLEQESDAEPYQEQVDLPCIKNAPGRVR